MSNDQARYYFEQGVGFLQSKDYDPALIKLENALSQVESWDIQFREKLQRTIEEVKHIKYLREEQKHALEATEMLKNSADRQRRGY